MNLPERIELTLTRAERDAADFWSQDDDATARKLREMGYADVKSAGMSFSIGGQEYLRREAAPMGYGQALDTGYEGDITLTFVQSTPEEVHAAMLHALFLNVHITGGEGGDA